jgi:prevent-host-death family protein
LQLQEGVAMTLTVSAADARARFARIAGEVHDTGVPVTVFKNSRPWVVIQPVGTPAAPSATTAAALDEARDMARKPPRFEGFVDMMAALNAEA